MQPEFNKRFSSLLDSLSALSRPPFLVYQRLTRKAPAKTSRQVISPRRQTITCIGVVPMKKNRISTFGWARIRPQAALVASIGTAAFTDAIVIADKVTRAFAGGFAAAFVFMNTPAALTIYCRTVLSGRNHQPADNDRVVVQAERTSQKKVSSCTVRGSIGQR